MVRKAFDTIIVGGGIVGTSVARELLIRNPRLKLAIVEKEKSLGVHQSGHNSGVIHSGVYYTPGSLKSKLCVEGLDLAYKYCDDKQIPYRKCGKLIVATSKEELPKLNLLFKRGLQNGVKDLTFIDSTKIREIEPNCIGIAAIWSPHTGIVDWSRVNKAFGEDCEEQGASIYLNFATTKFSLEVSDYPVLVHSENKTLNCRYVITCGGLYSDKLSVMSGCSAEPRIVPFRGDYLVLKKEKQDLVQTNIYPVPDIRLPFLDVHFTPRMDGSVWIGPNAILALKREGYAPNDFDFSEASEVLTYKGFQRLAMKHWLYGITQVIERLSMNRLVSRLQKYVPKLTQADVVRGPSGVRAQALNKNGELIDDFCFDSGTGQMGERMFHVRNAPSPAATSSLAIAKYVSDRIEEKFHLRSLYPD